MLRKDLAAEVVPVSCASAELRLFHGSAGKSSARDSASSALRDPSIESALADVWLKSSTAGGWPIAALMLCCRGSVPACKLPPVTSSTIFVRSLANFCRSRARRPSLRVMLPSTRRGRVPVLFAGREATPAGTGAMFQPAPHPTMTAPLEAPVLSAPGSAVRQRGAQPFGGPFWCPL